MDDPERPEPELPAAEAARVRRRERERTAKDRELMRTGQAKAFKQILDAQAKQAAEVATDRRARRRTPGTHHGRQQGPSEPPPPSR